MVEFETNLGGGEEVHSGLVDGQLEKADTCRIGIELHGEEIPFDTRRRVETELSKHFTDDMYEFIQRPDRNHYIIFFRDDRLRYSIISEATSDIRIGMNRGLEESLNRTLFGMTELNKRLWMSYKVIWPNNTTGIGRVSVELSFNTPLGESRVERIMEEAMENSGVGTESISVVEPARDTRKGENSDKWVLVTEKEEMGTMELDRLVEEIDKASGEKSPAIDEMEALDDVEEGDSERDIDSEREGANIDLTRTVLSCRGDI